MWQRSNPVNLVEIPVRDLDRAKAFYEYVFGVLLSVQDFGLLKMEWFPTINGAPGAIGTLVKTDSYIPSHAGTMVYFSIDDIEATLSRVAANGGKILRPKMSIGQYGFVGRFEDSQGNRVALRAMQWRIRRSRMLRERGIRR